MKVEFDRADAAAFAQRCIDDACRLTDTLVDAARAQDGQRYRRYRRRWDLITVAHPVAVVPAGVLG